jgi:hypothetical protein
LHSPPMLATAAQWTHTFLDSIEQRQWDDLIDKPN